MTETLRKKTIITTCFKCVNLKIRKTLVKQLFELFSFLDAAIHFFVVLSKMSMN